MFNMFNINASVVHLFVPWSKINYGFLHIGFYKFCDSSQYYICVYICMYISKELIRPIKVTDFQREKGMDMKRTRKMF